MKIADVVVETFQYKSKTVRDSEGHGHPGPEHDATQSLLRIITDEGVEGYCFGANKNVIEQTVKPILIGADPFYREKIWQIPIMGKDPVATPQLSPKGVTVF